jgi:hypothetical protein
MSSQDNAGRPPPRPTASRPRPAAPPGDAPAPASAPGAGPAPGPGHRPPARPAARPPIGGKGEWSPDSAAPPKPAAETRKAAPEGLLDLKPLTSDEADVPAPKGATQFFAVPATKKKAKVEEDEPVFVANKAPALPQTPVAPPAPPMGQGTFPGGPPGAHPGMYGGMPGMPHPGMGYGMGIQGPVVGGPQAAARPAEPAPEIERAQSFRVFAIVAGLLFMVLTALVVCVIVVAAVVLYGDAGGGAAPVAGPKPVPLADLGTPDEDEEIAEPLPPPPPSPTPRPPSGPKPPRPPSPTPSPAPAAPTAGGPVTLTLPPGAPWTAVEVTCPDVADWPRPRAPFSNGSATVQNVPASGCYANFKGGAPAKVSVRGGNSYTCTPGPAGVVCN